jgi:cellulose synthase operon protein C
LTRCHLLAAILLFTLMPAAVLAAQAPRHSDEIKSLELQYLAADNPEQRKQFLGQLKALAKSSPTADAGVLNAAVSAMLPAADSTWEAEELLAIGAANSAGQVAAAPSQPQDTEFLVDTRRASQEALNPSGDVETLADIRIDHLQQDSQGRDGLASAHVQQVWRINSVQGARSFSPRTVMYSGMSETLSMVRARVLKSDGREEDAVVSADQPVVERGASMYFDTRSRELRFSHLQPGDLVEIEYHLLPAAEVNQWTGYYARIDLFRDSFPTRLRRRVLIAPSSMKLYAVEHGLSPAVVRQNGAQTTRIWEASQIGAQSTGSQSMEALSPGAGASQPYLHVSTMGTMEEFGRWYSHLLEPGLQLDQNLRTVAQRILARNLTTQGKVQAVYESVKRHTKYTGFEFGVHSYQPYPVSTVEQRGFGDCKDKAAMLVALLRAVGVPAEFAMIRTRSAGAMPEGAYSVQLFDHAMVFVPELNTYLDGTAESAVPGELPPNDRGAMAMTVDAQGNATRRTVPFSASQANRMARQQVQANLAGDGSMASASQTKF